MTIVTCGGRIATCRCIRREMSLRAENEFFVGWIVVLVDLQKTELVVIVEYELEVLVFVAQLEEYRVCYVLNSACNLLSVFVVDF